MPRAPWSAVPWPAVLLGAGCLWLATPPVPSAGLALLVVPGLAVQFALATQERRPLLACWLLGALHVGAFSWSLRHVTLVGWLLIALLGGCYHAAFAAAVRTCWRPGRALVPVLAAAVATAGTAWLRAEMPGIAYPHGQPCHGLYEWPWALGAVALGGEPLANGLLGALGAALVLVWRGWRLGAPPLRAALATAAGAVVLLVGASVLGLPGPRSASAPTVAVAAVEPGFHPIDAFQDAQDRGALQRRWQDLIRARLLAPTQRIAGAAADAPPDLVLWPESSVPYMAVTDRAGDLRFPGLRGAITLADRVRLCVGGEWLRDRDTGAVTPIAALLGPTGDLLDHHEKQRLVPAGEFLPLVGWLPQAFADWLRKLAQTTVGIPNAVPGRARPPLRLAPGTGGEAEGAPFAAMVCYDNAFPSVVAGAVAAGARFVAVLSNEAWYRGGGELDQLAAITVLRAVATATPIVRCTTDGRTMAVDRDGRVLAALPAAPTPTPEPRVLRVDLPLGDGRLPPMAWAHPWLGWGAAIAVLLACLLGRLHGRGPWARLLRLGRSTAEVGDGPRPQASSGGS
ncbi:MAG: apolipoprotein N-acyltransferase [Planctomycetota bacterium]